MSEHKLSGKSYLLKIDPLGGTAYDTVVCLTGNSWEGTTDEIDASSKCGVDKLDGTQSESVSFEGYQLFNPATGKVSGADLFLLWKNRTVVGWQITPVTPVTGDEILAGSGFISKLSKDYKQDAAVGFSATLAVKGSTTQTIQA